MNADDPTIKLPNDHIIIDRIGMLHFLPINLNSETNKWKRIDHRSKLLGNYRVLLEVYILPISKNSKISLRCRFDDPVFQQLVEKSNELGCRTNRRNNNGTTKSIWIHEMGPANGRSPEDIARDFLKNMPKWYKPFMDIVCDVLETNSSIE